MLAKTGVELVLGKDVVASDLLPPQDPLPFDSVVIATGVTPRTPRIDGIDHPKVLSYIDVLKHKKPVGKSVAVVGAGGIGFDMAEYLVTPPSHMVDNADGVSVDGYMHEWGVDMKNDTRGGLLAEGASPAAPHRHVFLLQRKQGKLGSGLGKTSGWVHRANLAKMGVETIGGVTYDKIDDQGLHVTITAKTKGGKRGKEAPATTKTKRVFDVDSVVICAGQEPLRELEIELQQAISEREQDGAGGGAHKKLSVFRIGGAEEAGELDAKRAIDMGTRLAARVESAKSGDVFTMDIGPAAKYIQMFRDFRAKK